MGLDFFRRAVELAPAHGRPGMTVINTIQTNGTMMDGDWARSSRERFLVGLSMDGPASARRLPARQGRQADFDKVMRGLARLQRARRGVERADHRARRQPGPPRRGLPLPARRLRPALSSSSPSSSGRPGRRAVGHAVTDRSVTPEGWGAFLIGVFEEWVRRDVGEVFVQDVRRRPGDWFGEPPASRPLRDLRDRAGHGVQRRRVRLRPLRRAAYLLGNIARAPHGEIVASPSSAGSAGQTRPLPRSASSCPCASPATAAAPRTASSTTPDGEPGLNYLCPGYRAFFGHVDGRCGACATC